MEIKYIRKHHEARNIVTKKQTFPTTSSSFSHECLCICDQLSYAFTDRSSGIDVPGESHAKVLELVNSRLLAQQLRLTCGQTERTQEYSHQKCKRGKREMFRQGIFPTTLLSNLELCSIIHVYLFIGIHLYICRGCIFVSSLFVNIFR